MQLLHKEQIEIGADSIRDLGSGMIRCKQASPLFEIASVLVRLNHVATFIANGNHSIPVNAFGATTSDV